MSRVAQINWDGCRRKDYSIDLTRAAEMTGCRFTAKAYDYLSVLEEIRPVKSRQVAALAIANALEITARDGDDHE